LNSNIRLKVVIFHQMGSILQWAMKMGFSKFSKFMIMMVNISRLIVLSYSTWIGDIPCNVLNSHQMGNIY